MIMDPRKNIPKIQPPDRSKLDASVLKKPELREFENILSAKIKKGNNFTAKLFQNLHPKDLQKLQEQ